MKYTTVEERLLTFVNWPHRDGPYPIDLARAGFYYIGPGDRVCCAYCNGDLDKWSATDNPLKEHKRLLPLCPFLDGRYVPVKGAQGSKSVRAQTTYGNPKDTENLHRSTVHQSIPESCLHKESNGHRQLLNNSQIHIASSQQPPTSPASLTHHGQYYNNGTWHPVNIYINSTTSSPAQPTTPQTHQHLDYTKEEHRLKSFVGWRGQVDPRQLAHAGLYYLGNSDRVQCFSCRTIFRDWVVGDDPWIEHSKWYPDCPYIQLCMGKEVVKEIRRNVLKHAPIDEVDCVH